MELTQSSYLLGALAALLVGFSKTGVPGAAIPAVAMMAEAFRGRTEMSVGALLPILIVGDLFAITYYRRHAQWKRLWELFPFVIVGMVPGYLLLWGIQHIRADALRILLGALILVLLTLHLSQKRLGMEGMLDRQWFTGMMGMLAGFCTTIGNAAGPVMGIYLVSRRLDKHEFLGTAAWFFFLVNVSKIPFFVSLKMINLKTLHLDVVVVPVLVVGALVGVLVARRIPQGIFNALVLGLAGVAAVRLIFF
jgi:uncharacterized membrane protein YfcA